MKNTCLYIIGIIIISISCSKKTTPSETAHNPPAKPSVEYKAPIKTPTPKSIVVNSAAAKKDVNGRYYYDLEGKRYWRNKKDGKYYLYFKGMFAQKDYQ
ncbi:MAG TPA: hypothetical protein PK504_01570 [Ferruginibacter sp.]|nr:hypothetical protein [Ferruginibacter sp.]HRE63203.1 hypothetical protein [Ferruginibacter sp.]